MEKQNYEIELAFTPTELSTRAAKLLTELHQHTFDNLPSILNRIILDSTWSKLPTQFKNFGEYALSQSADGLGVDTNEKLWILRCALDFDGKHINEWKDVLLAVSSMVKSLPISERETINNSTPSLEKLAKNPIAKNKISYYPLRASGQDRDILTLNKKHHTFLKKISTGKMSRKEALIKTGLLKNKKLSYNGIRSAFNSLNQAQKLEFIDWLKGENYI